MKNEEGREIMENDWRDGERIGEDIKGRMERGMERGRISEEKGGGKDLRRNKRREDWKRHTGRGNGEYR